MEKIEKLALLPSGPATQLVIKFYRSLPDSNPNLVDICDIRYYVKRNGGTLSTYCKALIKLRNHLAHNNNDHEMISKKYEKFIGAIKIFNISNPEYVEILNRVIKKTKKIKPNNLEYRTGYVISSGCISGCDQTCPGHTLEECKLNWREQLKHKQILIIEGKYQGKNGIFKSWNGSNGYVYFDGKKQPLSCKSTKILIGPDHIMQNDN